MKETNTSKKQDKATAKVLKTGIDVHKKKYVFVCQYDEQSPNAPQKFDTDKILAWIGKQAEPISEIHTCYEAGYFGFMLHRKLETLGVNRQQDVASLDGLLIDHGDGSDLLHVEAFEIGTGHDETLEFDGAFCRFNAHRPPLQKRLFSHPTDTDAQPGCDIAHRFTTISAELRFPQKKKNQPVDFYRDRSTLLRSSGHDDRSLQLPPKTINP